MGRGVGMDIQGEFPYKLGMFAKREVFESVPGQKPGKRFGFVATGLELPPGGAAYVVECDANNLSNVKILGYIDRYGRAFDTRSLEPSPPARVPQLCIVRSGEDQTAGSVNVQHEGAAACSKARFSCQGTEDVTKDSFTVISLEEGFPFALGGCPYAYIPFMALAYLTLYWFDPSECAVLSGGRAACDGAQARGANVAAMKPFDLAEVFARLGTPDVFDAVGREVLEAESSWSEHPEQSRGIERFLVHLLREEGLVGRTPESFAVPQASLAPGASGGASAALGEGANNGAGASPEAGREQGERGGGNPSAQEAGEPAVATEPPHTRLVRTVSYANTFYLDFFYGDGHEIRENGMFYAHPATWDARCKFLGTEAALNRFLLLSEHLELAKSGFEESEAACAALDAWLSDRICTQAPDPSKPQMQPNRWRIHVAFARLCENIRVPWRFGYEFTTDARGASLAVRLSCPAADVMPKSRWDESRGWVKTTPRERNAAAARYAAHLALLVASCGFAASDALDEVCVNCVAGTVGQETVMSVRFARPLFERVFAAEEDHAFSDPFATLDAFGGRLAWGEDYALEPVEPLFGIGAAEFAGTADRSIARDKVYFNEDMRALVGVSRSADLDIFEDGARRVQCEEVLDALDAGVGQACACLKKMHDRTEDLVLRRICQGLLDNFALGDMDEQSYLEVREAFLDAYGFKPAMAHASALLRTDEARAVPVLEELAARADACEAFHDTATTCFRYFDSYEARVLYPRLCKDDAHGRTVAPLADEAYFAHDALAQVLTGSVVGASDAMKHAKRCVELAPSRASSYLRVARVHFMREEFAEEIAACCDAIKTAWNPQDVGLALYWMAFAFWKMDKYDAAQAAYRRCIMIGFSLAEQAATELAELLEQVKGLQRRSPDDEYDLLKREGVPLDALRENALYLLEVAECAVDNRAYALASVLAASAQRTVRDDALLTVLKSIEYLMEPVAEEG